MTLTQEWADAIESFILAQRAAGSPSTTCYTRRQHLQHLARRVDAGPWQLTPLQLIAYAGAHDWAVNTRRSRRATLLTFYQWAIATELTTSNPADALSKVRPPEPDPMPVPDDVYLAALARADDDEALWIDLAAEHGLRRAEIAQIHSDDIVSTLLGYDLRVRGKGGKRRMVPLTRPMARALLQRPSGWAFPGDENGHISPRWLGKRVNRLLEGEWTIHKLRHRAATRFWTVSDGDPYAVADLMGWANLNMVRVYVKQPSDRLRQLVQRASRAHGQIDMLPRTTNAGSGTL
jgi:integrase